LKSRNSILDAACPPELQRRRGFWILDIGLQAEFMSEFNVYSEKYPGGVYYQ